MGQQQLLLIVLGVIIVGVAIVAGLGLFTAGAEEAAKDEIVAQCLSIGANAQQWYRKPVAMGGGGGAFDGTNNPAGGWDVPLRMQATASCGVIGPDGTPTTQGYFAVVGDQTVTINAAPNVDLGYNFNIVCTVTAENIATVVNVVP